MKDDVYMISFSGGRSSAYMTDRLLRELPASQVVVCFANTGKEDPKTLDFVDECDRHWGGVVHWLEYDRTEGIRVVTYGSASRHGEPFAAMIDKRGYVPNVFWRFCTHDLKVRVIKRFMIQQRYRDWVNVLGIRYDEPARWAKVRGIGEKEGWDTWLPLVDWKVTKPAVLDFWRKMPFDLQLAPFMGNCDLCFLKGRNRWKRILTEQPEIADWWVEQEKKVGGTFRKGVSVADFLYQIRQAPTLFDYEDPDVVCFCNGD